MSWSTFALSVSENPTPEREQRLYEAVVAGPIVHQWATLRVMAGAHTLDLDVSEDALMVGVPGDAVRITVTATTAQRIADHFDALLLTPRVSDLIRQQATIVIAPATQTPDAAMGFTSRMVSHSQTVDARIAATGNSGLVANAGKDWVLTNRLLAQPDRCANYGWHVASSHYPATLPGLFVLQPLGLAHNRFHVDYSQTWRGMRRTCRVDGSERRLEDVLRDPTLAPLLSHEGPLQVFRVPGVPAGAQTETPPPKKDPISSVPRTLRVGMRGSDVADWQRTIGVDDDGVFGPATEAATKRWQRDHGLAPDGVVGPHTRAAVGGTHPFVQAKNFGKGRSAAIDTIVIHTMEATEKPDTAERVAAWFAGSGAPMASAHYCVDSDSIVQCVRDGDVAFHAPGVNQRSIGIEHAGYAKQSPEDWADDYSQTMLRRSAQLVASLCGRYGIPVRIVDESGLVAGQAGITTHAAVSRAFKKSTHTDPGVSFPFGEYLAMVGEYLA